MKKDKRTATATMIIKNIPVALRSHFRAWCTLRGVSMRSMLIAFMRDKLNERLKEKP